MLKLFKKKAKDAPAEAEATPAPAEGAEGADEAPKKKKLPLLVIIGAAVVLLGGGGGGAAFFLLKPKPAEAAHGEEASGDHGGGGHDTKKKKKGGGGHGEASGGDGDPSLGLVREGPDGVTFYTLPDMVVNIQSDDGRPALLKLKLTLEMHDADLAHQLQAEAPRMQDMFQSFLRELRPADLAGSAGSFALRQEILRRVNLIAAPGRVDAVLIEEMLVQ